MILLSEKCRYGCSIYQVALFSTHGALYGNIPEGRWAKPQLQPPKRSRFMAFSLSHLFLLQPLSRAASSLSLLNRGLVKQKNTGSSCMAVPLLTPPFGVWGWAAPSGLGSYGAAWARASGGARATAWATSVGSNKCIGRCHSLQLLRRA